MVRRAGLLAVISVLLSTSSALAATSTVKMVSFAFQPQNQTIAVGNSVNWRNASGRRHTATPNASWYWSAVTVRPGATSAARTLNQAGTFAYHCAIHPSRMKGVITVPMTVTPPTGTTATWFTLTLGAVTTPGVIVHDVDARQNGGTWVRRVATQQPSVTLFFPTPGTWELRTRLRYQLGGSTSGWSPVVTVQVT